MYDPTPLTPAEIGEQIDRQDGEFVDSWHTDEGATETDVSWWLLNCE